MDVLRADQTDVLFVSDIRTGAPALMTHAKVRPAFPPLCLPLLTGVPRALLDLTWGSHSLWPPAQVEECVASDQKWQSDWHKIMKPLYPPSLFHLPRTHAYHYSLDEVLHTSS